jgi:fluoroacetyl-CoA thioesterase
MALADLKPGLQHKETITIDERLAVTKVVTMFTESADMPPVFATAFLVGFIEWTCMQALQPFLEPEQRTLGIRVDLSHSAATPIGMQVTAEVVLEAVEDRKLRFKVVCHDEVDLICEGHHERFVVDINRFMKGLRKKQGLDQVLSQRVAGA